MLSQLKLNTTIKVIAVFLVLLFGFLLHLKNNALVPNPGESIDEYSNTWVGLSLLKFGIPVGISSDLGGYSSNIKAYVNVDQIYQTRGGDSLTLRLNWFDHPPLTGLISAIYTRLRGGQVFEDAITRIIRKPVIIAGVVTALAVFLLGQEIYSFPVGLLASILYTISPVVLFGSRPVQSENFLIPTTLISLFLLILFFKKSNPLFLIIAGIFAGLSTLFKLTGIYFILTAIILIISKSKKQKLINLGYFLVSALPISLLFVTYGAAINLSQFFSVFFGNTQRGFAIGPELFDTLIRVTKIGFRSVPDFWAILSWIATFITLSKIRKDGADYPLLVTLFSYVLFLIILGGNGYSWYFLPFFPITFLFLSKVIFQVFSKHYYWIIYFLTMAIIGVYFRRLMGQPSPPFINPLWHIVSLSTFVLYFSNFLFQSRFLNRTTVYLSYALFLLSIITTFLYGYNMTAASWFQVY